MRVKGKLFLVCKCVKDVANVSTRLILMLFKSFIHYSDAIAIGLSGITTPAVLRYNFYCAGDEGRLTDCVTNNINSIICGNRRVGLMCESGNIHKLVCIF